MAGVVNADLEEAVLSTLTLRHKAPNAVALSSLGPSEWGRIWHNCRVDRPHRHGFHPYRQHPMRHSSGQVNLRASRVTGARMYAVQTYWHSCSLWYCVGHGCSLWYFHDLPSDKRPVARLDLTRTSPAAGDGGIANHQLTLPSSSFASCTTLL